MTTPAKKAPFPVPAASPSTAHGLPPRGPNSSSKLSSLAAAETPPSLSRTPSGSNGAGHGHGHSNGPGPGHGHGHSNGGSTHFSSSSSSPVLLEEGRQQLGGLYERVAKLALDHHAAFEQEQDEGEGAHGDGEGEAEAEGESSVPFPTLADGPSRSRTPPCGGPASLLGLPREVLLQVLALLRAWDLAALGMTAKAFLQPQGAIEEAAVGVLERLAAAFPALSLSQSGSGTSSPSLLLSSSPSTPSHMHMASAAAAAGGGNAGLAGGGSLGQLLEGLRFQEVQHLHRLLALPEPASGHGYWVSKAWLSNHRRFAEALAARRKAAQLAAASSAASGGGGGSARRKNSRDRRESDVMVPWADVNSDITCEHGGLRPLVRPGQGQGQGQGGGGGSGSNNGGGGNSGGGSLSLSGSGSLGGLPMGKRRLVEKRAWKALRRYYAEGKAFKASATEECPECSRKDTEEKERLEEERRLRDLELAGSVHLANLFQRRSGSPPSEFGLPLDPGLYHLIPRCWLSAWRSYIRDPKAPKPRSPDISLLLCEAHGFPLIPPHVQSFLEGEKRGVLSSLNGRSGVVCEIVTPEEWDAIMHLYPTDYCLKFSVDPEDLSVTWSTPPCERCEPGVDDALQVKFRPRQRGWDF